jgi:hypothetical protein
MKTKREHNTFEGMRVIADYNVGDQRIIVLERSEKVEGAVAEQKVETVAKKIPPIAAHREGASSVGVSRPWLRGVANIV